MERTVSKQPDQILVGYGLRDAAALYSIVVRACHTSFPKSERELGFGKPATVERACWRFSRSPSLERLAGATILYRWAARALLRHEHVTLQLARCTNRLLLLLGPALQQRGIAFSVFDYYCSFIFGDGPYCGELPTALAIKSAALFCAGLSRESSERDVSLARLAESCADEIFSARQRFRMEPSFHFFDLPRFERELWRAVQRLVREKLTGGSMRAEHRNDLWALSEFLDHQEARLWNSGASLEQAWKSGASFGPNSAR
jgi:hypothetical protein